MAEDTLTPRPFNKYILNWIARHRDKINEVAQITGVPAAALALGPGEEATRVIEETPLDRFNDSYSKTLKDRMQDAIARNRGHESLADEVSQRESDIRAGLKSTNPIYQMLYPTMMDLGIGNVNLGAAILSLKNYLAETGRGGKYESDPFGWTKYKSDYSKFAADLTDPDSPLTFQVAGLQLGKANQLYANAYGDQYTKRPDNERAAYLTTAYKQSLNRLNENIKNRSVDVAPLGLLPPLPAPYAGDGSRTARDNYDAVYWLLRPPQSDDPSRNPAASVQSLSDASGTTTFGNSVMREPSSSNNPNAGYDIADRTTISASMDAPDLNPAGLPPLRPTPTAASTPRSIAGSGQTPSIWDHIFLQVAAGGRPGRDDWKS